MPTEAPSPSTGTNPKPNPLPLPSRNPIPLSAAQEAQVRDLYYKRVRNKCAEEVRGMEVSIFLLI